MIELSKIYEETKYLDYLFNQQNDIRNEEIIKKNILELLVEIGELANETRCFKHWSTKGPSEKEVILEEYVDCLNMILYFSNITGVTLEEEFPEVIEGDIVETFINLYQNTCLLKDDLTKEKVKRILVDIIYLSHLLKFSIEDLEKATKHKSKIIQKRFQENY